MVPSWLHTLSVASLLLGIASAIIVVSDIMRHPQKMWIMNIVWPVVSLFGGVLALWAYFAAGRPDARKRSFVISVGKAATHCGAGCALGDLCAEWLAFAFPIVAIWFGWHGVFAEKTFAVWILDFVFAFTFGVAFQYFTIVPMRGLSPLDGVWQAVKADALSLTAWQVGMYGFMAFAKFVLLQGLPFAVDSTEFWFMMQIAMLCGFATSYPANWFLLRAGIKEEM